METMSENSIDQMVDRIARAATTGCEQEVEVFADMQNDAVEFAESLRRQGAGYDLGIIQSSEEPKDFYARRQRIGEMPVWLVRARTNYSDEDLQTLTGPLPELHGGLAIDAEGRLVIVGVMWAAHKYALKQPVQQPRVLFQPGAVKSREGRRHLTELWQMDLERAADRYMTASQG